MPTTLSLLQPKMLKYGLKSTTVKDGVLNPPVVYMFLWTYKIITFKFLYWIILWWQVLPDASYQQTRHRVHWSRDVRMEHVSTKVLGLLPCWWLLQKAVWWIGRGQQLDWYDIWPSVLWSSRSIELLLCSWRLLIISKSQFVPYIYRCNINLRHSLLYLGT